MKNLLLLLALTFTLFSCVSNPMLDEPRTVATLYDTNAITKVVDSTYSDGFIILVTRHIKDDLVIKYDSVVINHLPLSGNDTLYHAMTYRGTEWILKNK
jgi:hypothetical protein